MEAMIQARSSKVLMGELTLGLVRLRSRLFQILSAILNLENVLFTPQLAGCDAPQKDLSR